MKTRRLGRTGHESTIAIFGAAAFFEISQADADDAMELVIEAGINHIDVAPRYGQAEERLGPWLAKEHDRFFLGCKTEERKKEDAVAEMQRSLERLQVDSFDLYQLHAVCTLEELDQVTGPAGALEAIIEAREEGLTRFIGITGHGMEAPSVFLNNHVKNRQVFSQNSKPFPAACFNTRAFQSYIKKAIKKVALVKEIDGFFWDEPHWAYSEENLLPTDLSPFYVCYCDVCKQLFSEKYQYKMPEKENPDILAFKEASLLGFLQNLCQIVKDIDATKKNTICVMPSHAETGISNWEKVCFEEMDVLASDPYWLLYQ